jgi:hypothetical protein
VTGPVSVSRSTVLAIALLTVTSGCSTVTEFTPASAIVSLTDEQSYLHEASQAYCENARAKGLATGEASIGALAAVLTGKADDEAAYWRVIDAERASTASVVSRIRKDLAESSRGLVSLDKAARELIQSSKPSRLDVTTFERALIHARQARDSLSVAIAKVNTRLDREVKAGDELTPLDRALSAAQRTADDLAAARSAQDVAFNDSSRTSF